MKCASCALFIACVRSSNRHFIFPDSLELQWLNIQQLQYKDKQRNWLHLICSHCFFCSCYYRLHVPNRFVTSFAGSLSPMPPLVVGRTLLGERGFFVGSKASSSRFKTSRSTRVRSKILPTLFMPSPKCRRLSFTKEFGSRMEYKIFDGYHLLNNTYRIEVKRMDHDLFKLCAKIISILIGAVFCI